MKVSLAGFFDIPEVLQSPAMPRGHGRGKRKISSLIIATMQLCLRVCLQFVLNTGRMEKKMETTIIYRVYIGVIYRDNGKYVMNETRIFREPLPEIS